MTDTSNGATTWEKTANVPGAGGAESAATGTAPGADGAGDAAHHGGDKRDELRAKIEASERRIAERNLADDARDAAIAARDYTRANPLKVVFGAIGLGIAIGLMTSPGRRAARNAAVGTAGAVSGAARSVGGAAKHRTEAAGTLIADSVIAYAIKLIDEALAAGRLGQDAIEDLADNAEASARKVKRKAQYRAGTIADSTRATARRTRRKAGRTVRDVSDRIAH